MIAVHETIEVDLLIPICSLTSIQVNHYMAVQITETTSIYTVHVIGNGQNVGILGLHNGSVVCMHGPNPFVEAWFSYVLCIYRCINDYSLLSILF